jgi:16S rRNA G966 N2-methylase RsmD
MFSEISLSPNEIKRVQREVEFAERKIRKGYSREKILKGIRKTVFTQEEIFSIAKNRIKAREKFGELSKSLIFDDSGLRYSTPPTVAEYRAERLKTDKIADISCGVGSQLIFFARKSREAIGIEISRKRALMAYINLNSLGIENTSIIAGDALSDEVLNKIDADTVFSDPARPPEVEVRTMDGLEPHPEKVYEKYKKVTERIAFELPPQMPPERITISGEKEYTSLNFRLNRLALYCGELAEYDVSAVSLPSREKVTSEDDEVIPERTDNVEDLLHEVDYTVMKANLLPNLLGKLGIEARIFLDDGKRTVLTSSTTTDSEFLRDYAVELVCPFSVSRINQELKRLDGGKITLRFSVSPDEYWNLRKKIEDGLKGEKWFYLFRKGDYAIISSPRHSV